LKIKLNLLSFSV